VACVYDTAVGETRQVAQKRELEQLRDTAGDLSQLFHLLRTSPDAVAEEAYLQIREGYNAKSITLGMIEKNLAYEAAEAEELAGYASTSYASASYTDADGYGDGVATSNWDYPADTDGGLHVDMGQLGVNPGPNDDTVDPRDI
jgi:hypothetical protein